MTVAFLGTMFLIGMGLVSWQWIVNELPSGYEGFGVKDRCGNEV